MKRTLLVMGLLVLWIGGCAAQLEARVTKRASHDLACAPAKLHIVDRYETVFRIEGCGAGATYECFERALATRCERVVYEEPSEQEVTTAGGTYSLTRPVQPTAEPPAAEQALVSRSERARH